MLYTVLNTKILLRILEIAFDISRIFVGKLNNKRRVKTPFCQSFTQS